MSLPPPPDAARPTYTDAYTWLPAQVLVEGYWIPGWLLAWRPDPVHGWRGDVAYTTAPGCTYRQTRPAAQIRPR